MRRAGLCGLLVVLAVVLTLGGCGSGGGKKFKYRIAVIPKGTTHDFWKSIHAGANKAGKEHGDVEIIWEGPPSEGQRQQQQDIVERFVSEDVSAIVLAPCDKQALVIPVEKALDKGVPVVIIDSGLEETPKIKNSEKYLGYVATNNRQGGVLAALEMWKLIKDRKSPRVIRVIYQAGSESTTQREAGFAAEMAKHKNVELITPKEEAGDTTRSAQEMAERLLPDYKDLDGIFTPNESSTTGFLQALRGLDRVGKVKFIGFDGSEILIKALRSGELDGLVLQDPFDMGYQGVKQALDYLEGKALKKRKETNLAVATKKNVDDPAIKTMYAPDLKTYLGQ
jgi:ribose transport system substrate-binding protein